MTVVLEIPLLPPLELDPPFVVTVLVATAWRFDNRHATIVLCLRSRAYRQRLRSWYRQQFVLFWAAKPHFQIAKRRYALCYFLAIETKAGCYLWQYYL